jgi:hypothetical protein
VFPKAFQVYYIANFEILLIAWYQGYYEGFLIYNLKEYRIKFKANLSAKVKVLPISYYGTQVALVTSFTHLCFS